MKIQKAVIAKRNEDLDLMQKENSALLAKNEQFATLLDEMALKHEKLNTLEESRINRAQYFHMKQIDLLENASRVSNNEAIEAGSDGIRDYENSLKIMQLERISTVQDFILASFAIVYLCFSQLSFGYRVGISMILLIIRMCGM